MKKETPTQMVSCEVCKIFKNSFSYRTPPVAASDALESNQSSLKQQIRRTDKEKLKSVHLHEQFESSRQ